VLHTASFAFVQAAVCRTPAKFCFTLDNTDCYLWRKSA